MIFWHPIIKAIKEHMLIDTTETDVFRIVEKKEDIISTIKFFEEQLMKVKHEHTHRQDGKAYIK